MLIDNDSSYNKSHDMHQVDVPTLKLSLQCYTIHEFS